MTLSTYPLFPLERDWTEHQSVEASDRTFSSDGSEGTYVAFRLLLNDESVNPWTPDSDRCHIADPAEHEKAIFLPSVACGTQTRTPIPDYSGPFWTLADQCGEMRPGNTGENCPYPGPATWLSVIGDNRFWPLASLTKDTSPVKRSANERMNEEEGRSWRPPGDARRNGTIFDCPGSLRGVSRVVLRVRVVHGQASLPGLFRQHRRPASTGFWRSVGVAVSRFRH